MENKSRFASWAITIGIVIVLNLFFNYAITLLYKTPNYDEYFARPQVVTEITNKEDCLAVGGQWTEDTIAPAPTEIKNQTAPARTGYCDPDYTKRQAYEKMRQSYERNVFIILVILGVISIFVGAFVKNKILVNGFSWGGVLSLIIASFRYWSNAGNMLRVVILAVALGALIWIAIKKFSK